METKRIPLAGRLGEGQYALVDEADYDALSAHRWYAVKTSPRSKAYVVRKLKRKGATTTTVYMHREVMKDHLDEGPKVDHINRDPLDNRCENLRVVSNKGNSQNVDTRSDCFSKHRNVVWLPDRQRWRAIVSTTEQGRLKRYFSPRFKDKADAIAAAAELRAEHFPYATD